MALLNLKFLVVQLNLQLWPPLVSDLHSSASSFPKYQKFSSQITIFGISTSQPVLVLKVWNFLLFLTSCKQPLDREKSVNWIIRCCNLIAFLGSTQGKVQYFAKLTFQMNRTFKTWGKSLQLPYPNVNEAKFWPNMTLWVVAYGRSNCSTA